jgi:hypothetical protein
MYCTGHFEQFCIRTPKYAVILTLVTLLFEEYTRTGDEENASFVASLSELSVPLSTAPAYNIDLFRLQLAPSTTRVKCNLNLGGRIKYLGLRTH